MGVTNPRNRELSSSSRRRPLFLCSRRCCTATLFLCLLLLTASYLVELHLSHTQSLPRIASSLRHGIRPTLGESRVKEAGGDRDAGKEVFPANIIQEKAQEEQTYVNEEAKIGGTPRQVVDTKNPMVVQSTEATDSVAGQKAAERREPLQGKNRGNASRRNDSLMMKVMLAVGESPCVTLAGQPCSEEETRKGPPAALLVDMPLSDDDVALQKAVAARYPPGQQQPVLKEGVTPRVAFLFLTRGPMPLARVWERFFQVRGKGRGGEGRVGEGREGRGGCVRLTHCEQRIARSC